MLKNNDKLIAINIPFSPSHYGSIQQSSAIENKLLQNLRDNGASEPEILTWTKVYQQCHNIIKEFKDSPLLMTAKLFSALLMGGVLGYTFAVTTYSSAENANFSNGIKYTATAVSFLVNAYLNAETAININKKLAHLTSFTCSCSGASLSIGMLVIIGLSAVNALPTYETFKADASAISAYLPYSEWFVLATRAFSIMNSSIDFASRTRTLLPFASNKMRADISLKHDAFKYHVQKLISNTDESALTEEQREQARTQLTDIATCVHHAISRNNWADFYQQLQIDVSPSHHTGIGFIDSSLVWARENKTEAVVKVLSGLAAGYLAYQFSDSMVPLTTNNLEKILDTNTASVLARTSQLTIGLFSFDWQFRGIPIFIMALLNLLQQSYKLILALCHVRAANKGEFKQFCFSLCELVLAAAIIGFTSFASSEFARLDGKSEADIYQGAAAGAGMNANSSMRISGAASSLLLVSLMNIGLFILNYIQQWRGSYQKLPSTTASVAVGSWILETSELIKTANTADNITAKELAQIHEIVESKTSSITPDALLSLQTKLKPHLIKISDSVTNESDYQSYSSTPLRTPHSYKSSSSSHLEIEFLVPK